MKLAEAIINKLNEQEENDIIATEGIQGFINRIQEYDDAVIAEAFLHQAELEQISTRTLINVLNHCKETNSETNLTEEV